MTHRSPLIVEADESVPGAGAAVTLISNPWVRVVSTDRGPAAGPVAVPVESDHAA